MALLSLLHFRRNDKLGIQAWMSKKPNCAGLVNTKIKPTQILPILLRRWHIVPLKRSNRPRFPLHQMLVLHFRNSTTTRLPRSAAPRSQWRWMQPYVIARSPSATLRVNSTTKQSRSGIVARFTKRCTTFSNPVIISFTYFFEMKQDRLAAWCLEREIAASGFA